MTDVALRTKSKRGGIDAGCTGRGSAVILHFFALGACLMLILSVCLGATSRVSCDRDGSSRREQNVRQDVQVPVEEVVFSSIEDREAGDEEPKSEMAPDNGYATFTHEHFNPDEEHTLHPWESLAARHKLGYDLMAGREDILDFEIDGE